MKTEFERNLRHTWLVLEIEQLYKEDYQMRMLRTNNIPGILKVHGQGRDEHSVYRYDISGKVSVKARGEKELWNYQELELFMRQFIKVLYTINQYLLNVNCLSLKPEHIYREGEEYFFCYCPGYEGDIREEFHTLTEYFVREMDYQEKEGIYLAYELHKASMEENYNIEQILENILERKEKEMEEKRVDHGQESYELAEDIILDDWAEQQEMTGHVARERQGVLEFLSRRTRRKRRGNWERDGRMLDDEESDSSDGLGDYSKFW
ncbi:DUF6382 domain-containing protein [Roseburia hominis]